MNKLGFLLAAVGVVLGGCSSLSGVGGTSEYACKAPPGVRCQSVTGTYENAIRNNLPSQQPTQPSPASQAPDNAGKPMARPSSLMATLRDSPQFDANGDHVGVASTTRVEQLRAPARIIRMWFKPWEDADRDLFDQGYIYVQVEGGRWLVDHAQRNIRDAYGPIKAPRGASAPSASGPSGPQARPGQAGTAGAPANNAADAMQALSALRAGQASPQRDE